MERTGIEPVTSGLQSRAIDDNERRRSGAIAHNHAGLRGTVESEPALRHGAIRGGLGVE
jgi:hypothetical protein